MKICKGCGESKSLEEFGNATKGAGGKNSKCFVCCRKASQLYRELNPNSNRDYYVKNKEASLAKQRAYYATHKEEHAKINAEYYARNAEAIKARVKAYATIHAAEIKLKKKIYRQSEGYTEMANEASRKYRANPENKPKREQLTRNYYAKKSGLDGTATFTQVQARIDYYGGLCWICSQPYTEIDHVKPVSKGGWGWPANLRPICRTCNASKSNKWPFVSTLVPA